MKNKYKMLYKLGFVDSYPIKDTEITDELKPRVTYVLDYNLNDSKHLISDQMPTEEELDYLIKLNRAYQVHRLVNCGIAISVALFIFLISLPAFMN